jgi:hypothetical protein
LALARSIKPLVEAVAPCSGGFWSRSSVPVAKIVHFWQKNSPGGCWVIACCLY